MPSERYYRVPFPADTRVRYAAQSSRLLDPQLHSITGAAKRKPESRTSRCARDATRAPSRRFH